MEEYDAAEELQGLLEEGSSDVHSNSDVAEIEGVIGGEHAETVAEEHPAGPQPTHRKGSAAFYISKQHEKRYPGQDLTQQS